MGRRWLLVFSTSSPDSCRSSAVNAPGLGDNRKLIGDLAIFTDELVIKLERATTDLPTQLGLSPLPRRIQLSSMAKG